MEVGKLRHRVDIQQVVESPDSYGQPVKTWRTIETRFAQIMPLTGHELVKAQKVNAEVSHKIIMRYCDLNSKNRLLFGARVFNILAVINIDERNWEIHVLAMENCKLTVNNIKDDVPGLEIGGTAGVSVS